MTRKYSLLYQCFCIAMVVAVYAPLDASARNATFVKTRASVSTAYTCHDLLLEVADTPARRAQGLMFRQNIPANTGMVLDYGSNQLVTLWMKNTPSSLDMLFVTHDGVVQHIHRNAAPYRLDHIFSQVPVRYAVELNAGFVDQHGLETGNTFRLASCPDTQSDQMQK